MNNTLSAQNIYNFKKANADPFVKALCFYFICLPLGVVNLSSTIGSALKFIALIPIIAWILTNPKIVINKPIKYQFLWVMWLFLTCIWSINAQLSFNRCLTQLMFLLLLLPAAAYTYQEKHLRWIRSSLVWSSRLTAAVTLILSAYAEGRLILKGEFILEDPNYLCAYFLFGIINAEIILASKNNFLQKLIAAVETIIYIYIVFFTGSRGGALAILMALLIGVFFIKTEKPVTQKIKFAIIAILCIFVILNFIPDVILKRFTIDAILKSNGTGRYTIWKNGIKIFLKSDIFRMLGGYGTASIMQVFTMYSVRREVMHNIFLEVLVESGIVGLLFYLLSIFQYVRIFIKKHEAFGFAVIIGMITLSLSTSLYAFKPYWNILIYAVCILNMENEENNAH